jgi:hypothetical protein
MMMHGWYLQGARARGDDRIGDDRSIADRARATLNKIGEKFLTRTFDELRPFKVAERMIRGGLELAQTSGYRALRLVRGSYGVMQAVLHRGTIGLDENGDFVFTGIGLADVFAAQSHRMKDMMRYMVGMRARELRGQGRENHIRPDEEADFIRLGEIDEEVKRQKQEAGEEYVSLEDTRLEWMAFSDRMFDFYVAAGILSTESRRAMQEANKNYVPFNRIIETLEGQRGRQTGGSPFMRLKGGTHNINDVFESMVGNTAHLIQMSMINIGKGNFYRMIDATRRGEFGEEDVNQTAGLYASPAPMDTEAVKIDKDQVLRSVVEGLGYDMRWWSMAKTGMVGSEQEMEVVRMLEELALGIEPMVTFFRPKPPKGNIDYYLENGERKYYEIIDPLLWEAIAHIGAQPHNLAVSILGGFANVLRKGVTLTPTFQAKNFIRDTMNAFTLSKGKLVPAADATKALLERVYNDEHYWEYMVNGGGFASMAEADGIDRDRVLDHTDKLRRAFQKYISAPEYANRIAEFKVLRKRGWAARDAALAGREISTDFAMRGSSPTLRAITISVPFLNARLQGLYRNGREIIRLEDGRPHFNGKRSLAYALRSFISIALPSVALYMLNKDDERYQEIEEWKKDLSWIWFYGPGEDDYFMIPKPFETGMLWGTLPERMMEYKYTHDEKELADAIGWMVLETFAGDIVPQMFQPVRDLMRNKKWTGAPVIPEYMEAIAAPEQYQYYTSDAMIALGRKMGISPMKAEHYVRGYLGTWGVWGLGMADYLVGDVMHKGEEPTKTWKSNFLLSPFVQDGPLRRTKSETDLYDMLKATREVVNTVRHVSNMDPTRLEEYAGTPRHQVMAGINQTLERAAKQMRELNKDARDVQLDETMSGDDKREALNEIKRGRNQIAREVRLNINPEEVQKLIDEIEQQDRAVGE